MTNNLPAAVSDLFRLINSLNTEDAYHWFTYLRILIETRAQDRHNDPSYVELGMTEELDAVRLTDSQLNTIIELLFAIIDQNQEKAVQSVWCLSKTFDETVIYRLLAMLNETWHNDDKLTAQVIKGVYDIKLLQDHWDLIERIANSGMPESTDAALQKLTTRRKLSGDC